MQCEWALRALSYCSVNNYFANNSLAANNYFSQKINCLQLVNCLRNNCLRSSMKEHYKIRRYWRTVCNHNWRSQGYRRKTSYLLLTCLSLLGGKSMVTPNFLTLSKIFDIVEFGSSNSEKRQNLLLFRKFWPVTIIHFLLFILRTNFRMSNKFRGIHLRAKKATFLVVKVLWMNENMLFFLHEWCWMETFCVVVVKTLTTIKGRVYTPNVYPSFIPIAIDRNNH